MDPDANLTEALDLAGEILRNAGDRGYSPHSAAERLAELVEALHGWIAGGGALPKVWAEVRDSELRAHRDALLALRTWMEDADVIAPRACRTLMSRALGKA